LKVYTAKETVHTEEPKIIKDTLQRHDKKQWMEALQSELESIEENKVWTVVNRPNDKSIIKTRWIFKIKRNADNIPEK